MFYGYDMDRTMLRIGAMNMMTHGIDNPCIEYRDSLSDQNSDKNKYTLVLANPPFKGSLDAESVSADLLKMCKTKKTELLFLTLFIRILQVGGRCACIVPDGVLFGSSAAHKAIRKEIVENQKLQAVISMPSGVFKPYALEHLGAHGSRRAQNSNRVLFHASPFKGCGFCPHAEQADYCCQCIQEQGGHETRPVETKPKRNAPP